LDEECQKLLNEKDELISEMRKMKDYNDNYLRYFFNNWVFW